MATYQSHQPEDSDLGNDRTIEAYVRNPLWGVEKTDLLNCGLEEQWQWE